MCNGYWEVCTCNDCKTAKGLYEDYDWHKDNKEEQEHIVSKLEDMGYSI